MIKDPVSWMKTKGEAGGVRVIALLLFAYAMAVPAAANADDPPAEPKSSQAERTELPEMIVTGAAAYPADTGYTVPDATTATKTDTPIFDTPVSIQVVPQQVLQDQQAYRIQDAVKNVSGVQQVFDGGGYDSFIVRGFAANQYRNGIRVPTNLDFANVQQVEVLKGPASTLYGRTEPGGLLNNH